MWSRRQGTVLACFFFSCISRKISNEEFQSRLYFFQKKTSTLGRRDVPYSLSRASSALVDCGASAHQKSHALLRLGGGLLLTALHLGKKRWGQLLQEMQPLLFLRRGGKKQEEQHNLLTRSHTLGAPSVLVCSQTTLFDLTSWSTFFNFSKNSQQLAHILTQSIRNCPM